jgi:hypothetical protein
MGAGIAFWKRTVVIMMMMMMRRRREEEEEEEEEEAEESTFVESHPATGNEYIRVQDKQTGLFCYIC